MSYFNEYEDLRKFIDDNDLVNELTDLHTDDTLIEIALNSLAEREMNLTKHLVDFMHDNDCDFVKYDTSMGTLETPVSIKNIDDLFDNFSDELDDLGLEKPETQKEEYEIF